MNAELKAKWLEALRSGKYQQTDRALRDNNGYCCLGVLCEVAGLRSEKMSDGDGRYKFFYEPDPYVDYSGEYAHQNLTMLPNAFAQSIDMDSRIESNVAEMNDGNGMYGDDDYIERKTFAEIADYLEQNL